MPNRHKTRFPVLTGMMSRLAGQSATPHRLNPITKQAIRQAFLLLLLFSVVGGMSGCDIKMPWDKPAAKDEKKAEEEAKAEPVSEKPEPVSADALTPAMRKLPFEEISLPMRDRLSLYGKLYAPDMKGDDEEGEPEKKPAANGDEEASGPKYPLVILLHGLNRTHAVWSDLPAILVKSGYAVLSLDLRGHGKSTRTSGGKMMTWRYFEKNDWAEMPKDVAKVISTFAQGEDYPSVDGKNVALIGEKLGANVAVLTSRKSKEAVKALGLISPGLDYKGLAPSQAILDFNHPVLLMSSQDDEYANKSTHGIYNWILGQKTLLEYGRVGDGAEMLVGHPGIQEALREWLVKTFPAGSIQAAELSKMPEG